MTVVRRAARALKRINDEQVVMWEDFWRASRFLVDHGDGAGLVLARVLLAPNDPGPALTLLQRLLDAAASQGRTGSIIEIQALRALALAACGDHASALGAFAEAVTLAHPRGYVRVLADEGAPMRALLALLTAARQDQQAPARGIHAGYLAALLRACGQADAAQPSRRAWPSR